MAATPCDWASAWIWLPTVLSSGSNTRTLAPRVMSACASASSVASLPWALSILKSDDPYPAALKALVMPAIPSTAPHLVARVTVLEPVVSVRMLRPPTRYTANLCCRSDAPIGGPGLWWAPSAASSSLSWSARATPPTCLLYTSDAADDLLCVDLGG